MTSLAVIVPTKNRPDLLQRAIAPFRRWNSKLDVIVVDDGSGPTNAARNRAICRALPSCRYVGAERSLGASTARNRGFRMSHSHYVWFIDDDDYVTERTISDVLAAVGEGRGRDVLLLPQSTLIDGTPVRLSVAADEADKSSRYRDIGVEVTTSCIIFPRSILERIDGWDESLYALQDTDLLLRAAQIARFTCLETEPVRVDASHGRRITSSLVPSTVGKLQFLRKHWQILPLRRRLRYLAQVIGCSALTRGPRLRYRLVALRWRAAQDLRAVPTRPGGLRGSGRSASSTQRGIS